MVSIFTSTPCKSSLRKHKSITCTIAVHNRLDLYTISSSMRLVSVVILFYAIYVEWDGLSLCT